MQRYEYALLLGYLTLTYVTIALPISMFSSTPDLYTSDGLSVLRTMALVTPVSLACMWRHGNLKLVIPTLVQRGCRAGLTAAMLLYLQGAALVAASLIVHRAQVQSVTALMAPDALDGLFLTLLGIGYLPTAATWGMAYLIGPGVALGAGAVVSPTAATPGRLPAFPLLAMLPSDTIPAGFLLALGPIAAGAAMYAKSPRLPWRATQSGPLLRAPELAGALIAIGVCGVVVAALCLASSGAVGRDLLADVGPHASLVTTWAVGLSGGTCLALLVLPRVALMVLARSAAAQRT
jgi:hypothetical protein